MTEVLVEMPRDNVALVRINRPEVRNALNIQIREQLTEHFTNSAATMTSAASS